MVVPGRPGRWSATEIRSQPSRPHGRAVCNPHDIPTPQVSGPGQGVTKASRAAGNPESGNGFTNPRRLVRPSRSLGAAPGWRTGSTAGGLARRQPGGPDPGLGRLPGRVNWTGPGWLRGRANRCLTLLHRFLQREPFRPAASPCGVHRMGLLIRVLPGVLFHLASPMSFVPSCESVRPGATGCRTAFHTAQGACHCLRLA